MSEREKQIMERFFDTVPELDKEQQNYLLGVAEGLAIARENETEKKIEAVTQVAAKVLKVKMEKLLQD